MHFITKFLLATLILVLVLGAFLKYRDWKTEKNDQLKLQEVKAEVYWIEDFYTVNSRYPSQKEFKEKFPNFGIEKERYIAYGLNNKDENPAQNFQLRYKLTSNAPKSYAIGAPEEPFGPLPYYDIGPCTRWANLGIGQPQALVSVYPPRVLIYTDLNAGKIFGGSDDIILLVGLDKPRIFEHHIDNKIYITNGSNVFSYDWDGKEIKLKNPQKIGEVPKGCPTGYLD